MYLKRNCLIGKKLGQLQFICPIEIKEILMELNNFDFYLVVDLEATCCQLGEFPTKEMETIEIGAVMLDSNLSMVDEFTTFIRPVRHPVLTEFCKNLTSITQQNVDNAPLYNEATQLFYDWLKKYANFLFLSWGDYDLHQLRQDCAYNEVAYPIPAPHLNAKKEFSKSQRVRKRQGMDGALKLAGLALEGTHHRGIDDAKNIAKLIPFVLGRQFIASYKPANN
jgi:inhibitor of KinA sporulation pathway (predicted exonuclease)